MWLIITVIAFLISSSLYYFIKDSEKYRLGYLSLLLLGASLMILVDNIASLLAGERLLEMTTEGLITSATLLGFAMLIPILLLWMAHFLHKDSI